MLLAMFVRKYPGPFFSLYQEAVKWFVKEDLNFYWWSISGVADEKRKYMERLREIIKQNYTSDFPDDIEIENHEKHENGRRGGKIKIWQR